MCLYFAYKITKEYLIDMATLIEPSHFKSGIHNLINTSPFFDVIAYTLSFKWTDSLLRMRIGFSKLDLRLRTTEIEYSFPLALEASKLRQFGQQNLKSF